MSTANHVAAEKFGLRVKERAAAMVQNRRDAYERFLILLALNVVLGGNYSPGTPKDTGFAQNSWVVGINGPPSFRQPPTPGERFVSDARRGRTRDTVTGRFASNSGKRSISVTSFVDIVERLRGVPLGSVVQLASNCAYIRPLEFGHSQQAPGGFWRITVAAAPRIARDASAEMAAQRSAARQLRNG